MQLKATKTKIKTKTKSAIKTICETKNLFLTEKLFFSVGTGYLSTPDNQKYYQKNVFNETT